MGEVYRAHDTKLKRDVALKILPSDVANDPDRLKRFQREAHALARLNNPHIVHIYSVEEDAGVHFLTMELVVGQSLDEVIGSDGLGLSKVFEIGIAAADALASAHANEIIHRDLKPANIIVTAEGDVKVIDFGLAAAMPAQSPAGDSVTQIAPLTVEGAVMGTVPYMSPEQLRGSSVDQRSDLFALGVVLFELATGQRPFVGRSQADVSSSILNLEPASLTAIQPGLPRHLGRIIARCLEKDPARRYHSAIDLRNELQNLQREVDSGSHGDSGSSSSVTTAPTPAAASGARYWSARSTPGAIALIALIVLAALLWRNFAPTTRDNTGELAGQDVLAAPPNSIAVLPFANTSPDVEQEYFSDGVAEELLNLLARIPELRVAARTSSFSFKGKNLELPEIARRLGVAHVLEGSVRRDRDQVRVTAQLVRAQDGFNVWSRTYDRTLDDIFAIQDEIAGDVVSQLKVTLLGESPQVIERDAGAFALYLQARDLARRRTAEGFEQSLILGNRALEIDPEYVEVLVMIASVYANQSDYGLRPRDEGFSLARASASKALAIDPDCAMAHGSLGWIARSYDKDMATSARHYERALALEPLNHTILANATSLVLSLGRVEEAIALGEHIIARDPVDPSGHTNLGLAYLQAGQWDDATTRFRTALELSPDGLSLRYLIGLGLLMGGDATAALAEFTQEADEEYRTKGSALALYALGEQEQSDNKLQVLKQQWGEAWPSEVAQVYAWISEADSAFTWLDRSIAISESGLSEQSQQPFFHPLHSDPRWPEFRRRTGTTQEQLDSIQFRLNVPE